MELDKLATAILMVIGLGVWVIAAQHEGIKLFSSGQQVQKSSSDCKQTHRAVRQMPARRDQDIKENFDKLRNFTRNCKAETIQVIRTAKPILVWGMSWAMGTVQFRNPHEKEYAKAFIARYPARKNEGRNSKIRHAAQNFGLR